MHQSDIHDAASQAVERSKSFLSGQIDQRSTHVGRAISATADDLRQVGDEMRRSGSIGSAAALADRGAEFIDRIGRYLQDADSDRLIADIESFGRQRPWAVAAGALLVGFAASRVLKASSARRYRGGTSTYGSREGASSYA